MASHSFKFQQTSPLSTLVRQTSSHRRAGELASSAQDNPNTTWNQSHFATQNTQQPSSPLLHSRFRSSTLTSSSKDYSSYLDRSGTSFNDGHDEYRYYDRNSGASIYSNITALPPSPSSYLDGHWPTESRGSDGHLTAGASFSQYIYTEETSPTLPTVVISSPDSDEPPFVQGRAAIVAPVMANFSRPVRPPSLTSEGQKYQVLERNSGRSLSPSAHTTLPSESARSNVSGSPASPNHPHPPATTALVSNLHPPLSTPSQAISSRPPLPRISHGSSPYSKYHSNIQPSSGPSNMD